MGLETKAAGFQSSKNLPCPALPWPEEFWSACVDFFTDGLCSKLQES